MIKELFEDKEYPLKDYQEKFVIAESLNISFTGKTKEEAFQIFTEKTIPELKKAGYKISPEGNYKFKIESKKKVFHVDFNKFNASTGQAEMVVEDKKAKGNKGNIAVAFTTAVAALVGFGVHKIDQMADEAERKAAGITKAVNNVLKAKEKVAAQQARAKSATDALKSPNYIDQIARESHDAKVNFASAVSPQEFLAVEAMRNETFVKLMLAKTSMFIKPIGANAKIMFNKINAHDALDWRRNDIRGWWSE